VGSSPLPLRSIVGINVIIEEGGAMLAPVNCVVVKVLMMVLVKGYLAGIITMYVFNQIVGAGAAIKEDRAQLVVLMVCAVVTDGMMAVVVELAARIGMNVLTVVGPHQTQLQAPPRPPPRPPRDLPSCFKVKC